MSMLSQIEVFNFKINSFILFNSMAFLASFIVIYFRYKKKGISKHYLPTITILALGGFIGSKVYYILEEPALFLESPFTVFFSFNGSGFLGGLILCFLLFFLYSIKAKIKLQILLNCISISVPFGIIFGRFACFMAGDGCYGLPSELPWAMSFPNGTLPTLITVHPAQLYEILCNIFILVIIYGLEKKTKSDDKSFFLFIVLFSIYRFFIEFIRLNERIFLNLTAPQIISIILLLIVVYLLKRKGKYHELFT